MRTIISEAICQTVDNYDCHFPFTWNGRIHTHCSFVSRDDITPGQLWCGIDQDAKSVGECKKNSYCPKRAYKII